MDSRHTMTIYPKNMTMEVDLVLTMDLKFDRSEGGNNLNPRASLKTLGMNPHVASVNNILL